MAHTSWFFETFLLLKLKPGYQPFDPAFEHLFNSYYNGVGQPFPRHLRGTLSRPTVAEVFRFRRHVDEAMLELLLSSGDDPQIHERTTLGLHHEQQHQELLLTDLKYNLGHHPQYPAYRSDLAATTDAVVAPLVFDSLSQGIAEVGAVEQGQFCFDNERPRHRCYLQGARIANRLVTNHEYLEFVQAGGYRDASLWLAEGWNTVCSEGWRAPLYWHEQDGVWFEYHLDGLKPLNPAAPVCHVSGFEADAYARFRGARLPSEHEWESYAAGDTVTGNFVEQEHLRPVAAGRSKQLFGDVWEWTSSAYGPYPGYRPLAGTLGEYNGKFMSSQLVLRGGSCASPQDHLRASYRNFFYPKDRWQFSGIRLALDLT